MNYSLKLATRYEHKLTNDFEANFDVEMRIFSKKMFFQNTVCWIKLKQQDGFQPQYI